MKQGWEYKKVGSICDIFTGKLDANAANENGLYPFFTCSKTPLSINTYAYDFECVLIAGNGDLNVKYYNGKFNAYQRTYILKLQKNIFDVDMRYIYDFFSLYIEELRRKSIGGIIKYIKLGDLTDALLPLPPLSTQLTIVSELDKINELIRLKKEQLKDYDNLSQSIFYEMFGDPVENEKGWEVKKLGEISSLICNGNTPKGGSEVYVKEGFLFLRSQNVWKNRIDLEDVAYIDESTHLSLKKSILKHNDLLITKTGRINTENSSLGRTALFEGGDGSANINGHVYLVRLKENMVHKYILYILISNSYRELIRKTCVGGIDKRQLNKDHIEDFPIIFPPIELQKIYSNRVSIIERQKSAVQQSITDLETLLASRMQYWFE